MSYKPDPIDPITELMYPLACKGCNTRILARTDRLKEQECVFCGQQGKNSKYVPK